MYGSSSVQILWPATICEMTPVENLRNADVLFGSHGQTKEAYLLMNLLYPDGGAARRFSTRLCASWVCMSRNSRQLWRLKYDWCSCRCKVNRFPYRMRLRVVDQRILEE